MPFLGEALADHIVRLQGLYSIQLPEALRPELADLVARINVNGSRRAVYVTDADLAGLLTSKRAEVLKWRTADDRVFVWERGAFEPDTSFQSAVRDFIGPRFPIPGGLCDRDSLAEICIRYLFKSKAFADSGAFFAAFMVTAKWIAKAYAVALEEHGNISSVHWTDQFLIEWAAFCNDLPGVVDRAAAEGYHGRFAWELLRIAGLIVPAVSGAGNPFVNDPAAVLPSTERSLVAYVHTWQRTVRNFIAPSGQLPVLLNELDRRVQGQGDRSPWRGLDWDAAQAFEIDASASAVGRAVFLRAESLSVVGPAAPAFPVAPFGAWWGVTEEDLNGAAEAVQLARPVQPQPGSKGLATLLASEAYLLETRGGSVSFRPTARKWRCLIQCTEIKLEYRERWRTLFVSAAEPAGSQEGDAWIEPISIAIKGGSGVTGTVIDAQSVGNILYLTCEVSIDFSAAIEAGAQVVTGSWEAYRTLALSLKIHDRVTTAFALARDQKSQMDLIVPSPFAPTIVVSDRNLVVSPSSNDQFSRPASGTSWVPTSTPEIQLHDERNYAVTVYDGVVAVGTGGFREFLPTFVAGTTVPADPNTDGMSVVTFALDDGMVVSRRDPSGGEDDLAVVRILDDKTAAVSSGVLAVLQGRSTGRRPPSTQATTSLLGRSQSAVARGVAASRGPTLESLFQIVVPSNSPTSGWPEKHPGTRAPLFLGEFANPELPGIGGGPMRIFQTAEWTAFSRALQQVCDAIGIKPDAQDLWLSAFDPTAVSSSLIREYNDAHAALIVAAKQISPAEAFWSSYPFSVVIVDGELGRNFGRLQAVLLSPLHPVRLSWLHAVSLFAQEVHGATAVARELLGLVEGWNFPLVGYAPSPTEGVIPLVAVPLDPGNERDFLGWSALAVLTNSVVEIPATATGLPLPWAGRSGINDKVISSALTDYLNVSPYVGSIVVDLRSVARAPRSSEIDSAVLEFLTDRSNAVVAALSGGARVWDSSYRQGNGPRRDELLVLRGDGSDANTSFEWRTYEAQDVPAHADIAFVENASVSLDIVDGAAAGFLGALPIRRILPADNAPGRMDQNFRPAEDEDVLGLARVLREIESRDSTVRDQALRASPSIQTLGIARGAKWEVIGTFNLSPRLLALTLGSGGQSDRLLWEWRPAWLNPETQGYADPSRRPYFVIARLPASLSTGLALRQGLTGAQIGQIVSELGRRAVGLATLYAAGDTHESAAAGFFYALQLLVPTDVTLPAAWHRPLPSTQSVIAIDPISELLQAIADKKFKRRADLLAIGCTREAGGTQICLTAIEIKHHGAPGSPQQRPDDRNAELKRAREQLKDSRELLLQIKDSVRDTQAPMIALGRRIALCVLLDFALDFGTRPVPASERAAIVADVLNGRFVISVGTPCLLWFAPGSLALNGAALIRGTHTAGDLHIQEAFIDPYAVPGLWWTAATVAADDHHVRDGIDEMMTGAVSACAAASSSVTPSGPLDAALRVALHIGETGRGTRPSQKESVATPAQPILTHTPVDLPPSVPIAERTAGVSDAAPLPRVEPKETASASSDVGSTPQEPVPAPNVPELIVGTRDDPSKRWTVLGKLATRAAESVGLDLDQPKVMGIFGYMGSGKSYLAGAITEAAVQELPSINHLGSPLAVVVFNYRRNASDRFELSSLFRPNGEEADVARLAAEYGARPAGVQDIQILTLRGELNQERLREYEGIPARELLFRPASLTVEDWELLMGQPGRERVYAQAIRHALIELRDDGDVSVGSLRNRISQFAGSSRGAAEQRLTFASRHLSEAQGVNFEDVLKPGRILIVDLRQPLFNRDDALRFFLVCANQISRVQGRFNKLIIFDEAHEYLSEAFGEKLESRIRQIRHEGTSYIFATQDVGSIPTEIQRFVSTKFVFGLGSRQNVDDLLQFAPEFRGLDLVSLAPGTCFVQATTSSRNLFTQPKLVKIRPRVTAHGGGTRIFS